MSYVVHPLEHPTGELFLVLGPQDAVSIPPIDSPTAWAELTIGWAYASGGRPHVRCHNVNAAAQGTRMVVQTIGGGGFAQSRRVRVILLDGSAVDVMLPRVAQTRSLTSANTYVDVWFDNSWAFDHFGEVDDFERDSTEGSAGLLDEIDAARAQHGVD